MGRNDTGQITTLNRELIKTYYVRAAGVITTAYQASASASHGDVAVKTTYAYDGNGDVEKMKEELTTWDVSWEI